MRGSVEFVAERKEVGYIRLMYLFCGDQVFRLVLRMEEVLREFSDSHANQQAQGNEQTFDNYYVYRKNSKTRVLVVAQLYCCPTLP